MRCFAAVTAAAATGDGGGDTGAAGDGSASAALAAALADSGALELLTERGLLAVAVLREALHNATVVTLKPGRLAYYYS
jgi:hypothetical protein